MSKADRLRGTMKYPKSHKQAAGPGELAVAKRLGLKLDEVVNGSLHTPSDYPDEGQMRFEWRGVAYLSVKELDALMAANRPEVAYPEPPASSWPPVYYPRLKPA